MVNSNNKENGSIDVLVGSHREGVIPHYLEETEGGYNTLHIRENQISDIDKYVKVTVDLKPGDVLLFHPNLVHKSNMNHSDRVRYTLTAHFLDPLDENFKLLSYNEIIRLNRTRCINADECQDLINQEKQTNY
jgi:ectoine hydroxylase